MNINIAHAKNHGLHCRKGISSHCLSIPRLDPPADRFPVLSPLKRNLMHANIYHSWDSAVGILSWGLFVSVSVGCLMQVCFCDGWLQRFSEQDREPGAFPLGIRTGGGNQYVWLILPDVSSAEGTEPQICPNHGPPTQLQASIKEWTRLLCRQRIRNKRSPNPDVAQVWPVMLTLTMNWF